MSSFITASMIRAEHQAEAQANAERAIGWAADGTGYWDAERIDTWEQWLAELQDDADQLPCMAGMETDTPEWEAL